MELSITKFNKFRHSQSFQDAYSSCSDMQMFLRPHFNLHIPYHSITRTFDVETEVFTLSCFFIASLFDRKPPSFLRQGFSSSSSSQRCFGCRDWLCHRQRCCDRSANPGRKHLRSTERVFAEFDHEFFLSSWLDSTLMARSSAACNHASVASLTHTSTH